MKAGDWLFVCIFLPFAFFVAYISVCYIGNDDADKADILKIKNLNVPQAAIDKVIEDDRVTVIEFIHLEKLSKENDRRDFIRTTLSGEQKDR